MDLTRLELVAVVALVGFAVACAPEAETRAPFTGVWIIKSGPGPATSPTSTKGGSSEAPPPDDPAAQGGPAKPTDDGCEGIPEGGTCAGNALRICVGERVVELSCDDGGGYCVVNKVQQQATCIYPDGGNPCAAMTDLSTCKDDVVLWCEEGVLKAADCVTVGKVCAYDESQGFDACVPPP